MAAIKRDYKNLQLETWAVERLIPYARNPRKNDEAVERMVSAITEFGFRIPIIAQSDGTVVDGHLRLKAAQALGLAEVPVILADGMTDAQVKAFRILANRSASWAEWDDDLLKVEFEELQDMGFDLVMTGFDAVELEKMLVVPDFTPAGEGEQGKLDEIDPKPHAKCPECGHEFKV